ncbi:hypothetical protein ACWEOE_40080 [Amycolatopsis sp. NPDC004368]
MLLERLAATARTAGLSGSSRWCSPKREGHQGLLRTGLPYRLARDGAEWSVTLWLNAHHCPEAIAHRDEVAEAASLTHVPDLESVAVIGPGRQTGSVCHPCSANLLHGGYPGHVEAVNPHAASILAVQRSPSITGRSIAPAESAASASDERGACGNRLLLGRIVFEVLFAALMIYVPGLQGCSTWCRRGRSRSCFRRR